MAKGDMKVLGLSGTHAMRVAASATRGYAGEPVNYAGTYTSGVGSVNVVTVAADGTPVIGTDCVAGILATDMKVNTAGTVIAQRVMVSVPIPFVTRIRSKVKTASTADTETEAIGLMWDFYIYDLTTSTYTWDPAAADTGAYVARDYNVVLSQIDCVIDPRGMRADIS